MEQENGFDTPSQEMATTPLQEESEAQGAIAEDSQNVEPTQADGKTEQENALQDESAPQAGSDEWFAQDRAAFDDAYPEVDKAALFATDTFLDYAEGKLGQVPLATIYQGYTRLLAKLQSDKRVQAAREASPGSLRQAAHDAEGEFFTLKQMQTMSPAYIEAHWDKVQRSLKNLSTKQA